MLWFRINWNLDYNCFMCKNIIRERLMKVKIPKPKIIPKEFTNGEIKVFLALKKLGVIFLTQNPYTPSESDITFYPDFFIYKSRYPQMKCEGIAIEFDSILHRKRGRMAKDEERDKLFEKDGVVVIRIKEEECKSVEDIIKILKPKLIELGVLEG